MNEKFMRNAPTLAVLIAMFIQVPRVSSFGSDIGAGILAPIFAVFLGMSIYVLSYWHGRSEYHITADKENERAKYAQQSRMKNMYDDIRSLVGFWLTLFVIIEGLLNLAETLTHVKAEVVLFSWQWFGAFAYGIFPTLAAFGMGAIQAKLHRIPHGVANASWIEVMFNAIAKRIASLAEEPATQTPQPATHPEKTGRNAGAYPKECPYKCGATLQNANAYSAHMRYCPEKNKQNNASSFLIPKGTGEASAAASTENQEKPR
jgi:hypothetical protein